MEGRLGDSAVTGPGREPRRGGGRLAGMCLVMALATIQLAAAPAPPAGPLPQIAKASWIWHAKDVDVCHLRTTFTLEDAPRAASILITADNGYELYVNGVSIGFDIGAGADVWNSLERYDLAKRLTSGINVIGIRAICLGGMRGLVAAARIEVPGQEPLELFTNASWHVAAKGDPAEYSHPDRVEGPEWQPARVLGPMGMAPWGMLKYAGSKGGRRQGALPSAAAMTEPDANFRWPAGLAFVADDCSVYVPLRGDAWGVCFRVGNWSRAYTEFDLPCPSKIGRKLYVVKPLRPEATPRLLLDAGKGVLGSPSASYDGANIYVAMAAEGDAFFHIYRVPVAGGPPQQLTDGPFHDIDPVELPDGRLVFTSTRIGTFEEYHCPPSRALFAMQPDGSGIEPITFTLEFDNEAKVMADGRLAFIRTDNFFDRAKVETRIHAIRPDGTDGVTEYGADVGPDYGTRLRAFGYGSPAPLPDGRLACISNRGVFVSTPGAAEASFQRLPRGIGDLAPLPDNRLLATVLRPEGRRMISDVIGVVDPSDGRIVKVYQQPDGSVHSPVFLGPRPRPRAMAEMVNRDRVGKIDATGFLYCQNVRFTNKTKADWSRIRAVRIVGAKALTVRSSHSHIVHAGHETVELGTVPLAPDGSIYAEVPADMPLALQAVDAEGRSELNEMSWIYVRPGERRSCLGCHQPRRATPSSASGPGLALKAPPAKLLGQGDALHFRGNNAGVTGMMDLQFERYRETASLNRYPDAGGSLRNRHEELKGIAEALGAEREATRVAAARRLALLRAREAAPALSAALHDPSREVRLAAALAVAACGTRDSVMGLLGILSDPDPVVAQAAAVALENLTGHAQEFRPFGGAETRQLQAAAWRTWFRDHSWDAIEAELVTQLQQADRVGQRAAAVALGHVGGDTARKALREFVTREKDKNPYPPFVGSNRTDRFTFSAESPLNPRTLQEAVRALGYLNDTASVPLLGGVVSANLEPKTANLFLAEAAIEALGRIGTEEAEAILIQSFGKLRDYVRYVGWYSDHPALYACHASPLHARIITALDAIGSTRAGEIVPQLIRSIPTDPDRALFPANDTYETLTGRVIRRSGKGEELIETCLALLGDSEATAVGDLKQALSAAFGAWAGKPAADNRAAQVLSLMYPDRRYEPRVRAAYERYRAKPEDPVKRALGNPKWIPQRHWVLFYLGRTLGNIADSRSVKTLQQSLAPELNEARHGRPDPAEPTIHFLQLEYTPCWRAAAAWALGRIGDHAAVPTLLETVGDLRNATDTRHAAAVALGRLTDAHDVEALRRLTKDYPEVSTRRALLAALARAEPRIPAR